MRVSASKNILINIVLIMFCFSTKAIDQEVISDAFLPKRANHEQYQELFNNAYNFLEFCEDTASNFQRSDYFEENINRVYASNIESAQFIINALHHLDCGGLTVDSILQSCLLMRLQLIKSHANLFHQSQEYYQRFNQLSPIYPLSTNPKILAYLQKLVEGGDKIAARDLKLTQENINRFQFLNLMIKLLFNISDPQSLSAPTKECISCSRTLWPLLRDETTDLSHVEFATITKEDDPQELQDHKDYNYYYYNFELLGHPRTLKGWGDHVMTFNLSRFEITQEDPEFAKTQGWKHVLPLPRPSWLYPEKSINVPIAVLPADGEKITTISQVSSRRNNKSGSKHKKRKSKNKAELRKQRREQPNITKVETLVQLTEQEDLLTDQDVEAGHALAEGAVDLITTPIDQAPLDLKAETDPIQPIEATQPSEPQVLSEDDSLEADSSAESEEELEIITAQAFPPLQPRGVRLFHEQGTSSSTIKQQAHHVNAKVRKIIETIFDYRLGGQGFNFSDFKTVWEHINGPGTVRQSGSGSSHYALLNKEKKVVGGTFAHGNGHEYNQKTVRYLRAALNAVGIFSEGEQRP